MEFDYCQKYLRSISIFMSMLRKANSHSDNIYRLIKNQQCETRSRRKMIQTLTFFKLPCASEILSRSYVM